MGKLQKVWAQIQTLQMKPLDFILILLLMMASFTPFLLLNRHQGSSALAQLRVNSQVVKTFDLRQDQTYTYKSQDGDINEIEVKGGKIAIVFANCGDQICVRKGFIDKTGQTIVCLPHRLVIEVLNSDKKDDGRRIIDY